MDVLMRWLPGLALPRGIARVRQQQWYRVALAQFTPTVVLWVLPSVLDSGQLFFDLFEASHSILSCRHSLM